MKRLLACIGGIVSDMDIRNGLPAEWSESEWLDEKR